jgi:hypothetical protein
MRLNLYLKRAKIITGPLAKRVNTSHSALEVILKFLTNREQFKGGEVYLHFGNACHEQFALGKHEREVTVIQQRALNIMCKKLHEHPVVKRLLKGAIQEVKKKTKLNGVLISYILDIHQLTTKLGGDLKTTTAKSLEEFVEKAIEFGYPRQGVTYKVAEKLKDFIFIGIQKEPPYNVYIMILSEYPDEIAYSMEELEFLLYFFQNYGKVLRGGVDMRVSMDVCEAVIKQLSLSIKEHDAPAAKKLIKNKFSQNKLKTTWQRKQEKRR